MMRKAMLYASYFGLRVISHCEDLTLAEGGQMNEGTGRPCLACAASRPYPSRLWWRANACWPLTSTYRSI